MVDRQVVAMTPGPGMLSLTLLVFFIALPAIGAWHRRHRSRLASEAAAQLAEFATCVRSDSQFRVPDEALQSRLARLRVEETAALQLALELGRGDADLLADAAQRLSTRLRRRVAFERKTLARTASGLRRGAIAATVPPVAVLATSTAGIGIPVFTQCGLVVAQILGCVLLWRLARVEI
jgi:hypothetical protein